MITTIIAILAPAINCVQLIPQLYKTYMTKSVDDLSIYSLLLILLTASLWFLHGLFIRDTSLIVAGAISIVISTAMCILYLIYQKV
jgi:MtN3 and saliva related transmembrane protein